MAQQISFDSLWKERNRIPNSFIAGKISKEYAIKRITFIHNEFRKRGKTALALEKELFESSVYYYRNQLDEGISIINRGINNIKTQNDSLSFKYYALAALMHQANENYTKSAEYFNRNFELLKFNSALENSLTNEVIAFYNNYTAFLAIKGDFKLLEDILFRASRLCTKLHKTDYLGIIEAQLGNLYFQRKNYTLSEKYYFKAISNTENPYFKIPRLISLGEIYIQQNNPKKLSATIKLAKKNLRLVKNGEDKYHNSKLRIALLEGKTSKSPNLLINAVEEFQRNMKARKNIHLVNAFMILGDQTNHKEKYYSEAILSSVTADKLENIISENVIFPNLYMQANKKLASVQDKKLAKKTLEKAAHIASQINKSLVFEDQKYAFEDDFRALLSQGLLIDNSPSSAFNFIEMAKAKVLNDALFEKSNQKLNVKPEYIKKEKKLQKKINKLRINKETSGQKELTDLEIELGFLKKKMEDENPKYYKSKYEQEVIKAEQIQKKLMPNEAFLNYFRDNSTLYISVITTQNINLIRKDLPENYETIINDFIKLLYNNPGLGIYKRAQSLIIYELLFEPVMPFLNKKNRITVVRDLELNLIPFEVLESKPTQFLLDKYTFSYDYSASISNTSKSKPKKYKIKNQLGIAPFADKISILKNIYREKTLQPLPYSDDEISSISGTIFKNDAATKNRFLEDYRKHDILHFATHAQVDDSDPSKSFIAFYPDGQDYKLFTEELYNLDLSKTQLVILSACEAGNGKLLAGEGLLSLSRGFSYAGCPAVITTLWKAHDESTAWISSRIHKYLDEGLEKAEAVRMAKIDFRKSNLGKSFDHPYYWANFVLIGEGAPLQISFWSKYKWFLILGLMIIAALIYYYYRSNITERIKKFMILR
jgi:CHAT domain-containing protein